MKIRHRRSWRFFDFVLLASLLALCAWFMRQPLWDMFSIGLREEEQSHIFLAPLVAGYLLWLRRSRLRYTKVQYSMIGPAAVLVGWLICWWGFDTGRQAAWHAGALTTVVGCVLTMTGLTALQLFAPVFAVLVFAIPVPGEIRHEIAYPMQELATSVTHAMLELIGISAVKSGNVLVINGEQVAVGEACNGMRMVFALTLVVYAFAFGTPLKMSTRILLLVMSPVIAIVCNVIRLVPTSLIFGYGDIEMAERFHDLSGWVMLPVALLMLFGILRTVRWLEFPVTSYRLASQ